MQVLVVYATRHGSTREVAGSIAAALREQGASVESRAAHDFRGPIGNRDLVVLGGPLYAGRWHRDARRFLTRRRKELLTIPVAVFAVGRRRRDLRSWDAIREWGSGLAHDLASHR